jgi:RNA recognition motif-containing protein
MNHMTTAVHLSQLFVKFGLVYSVEIIRDNVHGSSSGIGFIKMDKLSGAAAIYELNNFKFMNCYLEVSEVPM